MRFDQYIPFADATVAEICRANFSSDGIGVTYADAAAVTDIGQLFKGRGIASFDEFRFFTGIRTLPGAIFNSCDYLESIVIPANIETFGTMIFAYSSGKTPDGITITFLRGTPPQIGGAPFIYAKVKEIRVPIDSVAAYKSANNYTAVAEKIVGV